MAATRPAESPAHIIKANGMKRRGPVSHGWSLATENSISPHAGAGKHKKGAWGATQDGSTLSSPAPALFGRRRGKAAASPPHPHPHLTSPQMNYITVTWRVGVSRRSRLLSGCYWACLKSPASHARCMRKAVAERG